MAVCPNISSLAVWLTVFERPDIFFSACVVDSFYVLLEVNLQVLVIESLRCIWGIYFPCLPGFRFWGGFFVGG